MELSPNADRKVVALLRYAPCNYSGAPYRVAAISLAWLGECAGPYCTPPPAGCFAIYSVTLVHAPREPARTVRYVTKAVPLV